MEQNTQLLATTSSVGTAALCGGRFHRTGPNTRTIQAEHSTRHYSQRKCRVLYHLGQRANQSAQPTRRIGIAWPLYRPGFSQQGHSGAWVTDKERNLWFGMVVEGADPPSARTYALLA